VVDRLHGPNHACAHSYKADRHPTLAGINTQSNEQYNSDLQRLRSHLAYMSPTNFTAHLRLYMYIRNLAKPNCAANQLFVKMPAQMQ
jgi:hypothetical protein